MSFCSFRNGEVYKDHFKPGIYVCSKCDHQLFSSRSKYEHSSPWPAFTETIQEDSVSKREERRGAYKVLVFYCIVFKDLQYKCTFLHNFAPV
uniref:Methionine sulfoxide reductase B1 n=1 Tax=Amphiprion percula TaxID=161767 RepID=A0A3P8SSI7_AMPPE